MTVPVTRNLIWLSIVNTVVSIAGKWNLREAQEIKYLYTPLASYMLATFVHNMVMRHML